MLLSGWFVCRAGRVCCSPGQAEVIGSDIAYDEKDLDFQLKRYDYFGSSITGLSNAVHHADVVALTKLSRLVLPHEHLVLLQPKSIGCAEKSLETCSPVEHILHLEPIEKEELGFQHQEVSMPFVPTPDEVVSVEELLEQVLTDPCLPMTYRNEVATAQFIHWPVEIRFCEPTLETNQTKSPPSLRYWFRAKGKVSDDQALHRCVAAYTSDIIFLQVSMNPHRLRGLKMSVLSLDHSPFRADEWVLYVIFSPTAFNVRGFVTRQMFNQKGELLLRFSIVELQLLVSLVQEGLTRKHIPKTSATNSKL